VAANGLTGKARVHQIGLGHARGMVTNHLGKEHQIGFDGDIDEARAVDETFPVRRLDDVVRGQVAVLKLDVEGMEADVLEGASRILDWHRPIIYAEAWNTTHIARIEKVLRDFGYEASGRVFNATPTYEFIAPDLRGRERLRPFWRRMPATIRKRVWGHGRQRRAASVTEHAGGFQSHSRAVAAPGSLVCQEVVPARR
jgi:hypothetical protein